MLFLYSEPKRIKNAGNTVQGMTKFLKDFIENNTPEAVYLIIVPIPFSFIYV